jgi:hypothetical protein
VFDERLWGERVRWLSWTVNLVLLDLSVSVGLGQMAGLVLGLLWLVVLYEMRFGNRVVEWCRRMN